MNWFEVAKNISKFAGKLGGLGGLGGVDAPGGAAPAPGATPPPGAAPAVRSPVQSRLQAVGGVLDDMTAPMGGMAPPMAPSAGVSRPDPTTVDAVLRTILEARRSGAPVTLAGGGGLGLSNMLRR